MDEQHLHETVEAAVKKAFSAGVGEGRYIDMSRVPLICQSIIGIDEKLSEMKTQMVTQDQFWPVKTLVYGVVGILLTGVIVTLLALVLKTQ